MQRLPLVHDINDFVGLKVVITHFNRCNIGNLVAETAVALNQDNRRLGLVAFLKPDNQRAVVQFGQSFFFGDFDNIGTGFVRVTFAEPEVKMCLKVVIVLFDRVDRNLAQMLPGLAVFQVAVLQFGGNLPRFFLGGFVFLAADVGFL